MALDNPFLNPLLNPLASTYLHNPFLGLQQKQQQLASSLQARGKRLLNQSMRQKGIDLNHDFYVVFGKQCRTENEYSGHQHNIFIKIN